MRFSAALFCALTTLVVVAAAQQVAPQLTLLRELFLTGGACHALQYSPDGKLLASGEEHGDVVLFDAETGAVRHLLETGQRCIGSLGFCADGTRLAAAGDDVTLWDVTTGKELARIQGRIVQRLTCSRDGRHVAFLPDDHIAVMCDTEHLTFERDFALAADTWADAVAFSPDGKQLAVGDRRGKTTVFTVDTGERVHELEQDGWVQGLAWLDDGRLLRLGRERQLLGLAESTLSLPALCQGLAAAGDGRRALVRTDDGVIGLVDGHEAWQLDGSGAVALHPDGTHWARAWQGEIEVRRGEQLVRTLPGAHRQQPGGAALTGDGRYAILDGTTRQVFDTRSGAAIAVTDMPTAGMLVDNPGGVEFAVLQRWSAEALLDGVDTSRLDFWAIDRNTISSATARLVRHVDLPFAPPQPSRGDGPPCLSGDQRFACRGGELLDLLQPSRSLRLENGPIHQILPAANGELAVARTGVHGHLLMTGFGDVMVYRRDGTEVAKIKLDTAPLHLAVAPDDNRLALTTEEGLSVRHLPDLAELRHLPWSWDEALWLDDEFLLGPADHALQIGDLDSGEIVAQLPIASRTTQLHYNRDRGLLLVVTRDRALLVHVELSPTKSH